MAAMNLQDYSRYGYREYMLKRYFKMFGEKEILDFLNGNEERLVPTIKVNTLKISREDLKKKLIKKGFVLEPISVVPNAFYVKNAPFSIGATTEYLLGYYYIQRVAPMIPCIVLNPSQEDIVVFELPDSRRNTYHYDL